ncbi:hypothetical protein CCACVL1_27645 [Corchorus capsularis]|uniref:Uncharacterized protein n=1 Tax=Corchorus capsularis TaxID=210143 RepID=A0A1R3G9D9_COCAP|nr:hypothetical protein CCACVL1_27645 [Corchorus capsularis]
MENLEATISRISTEDVGTEQVGYGAGVTVAPLVFNGSASRGALLSRSHEGPSLRSDHMIQLSTWNGQARESHQQTLPVGPSHCPIISMPPLGSQTSVTQLGAQCFHLLAI